MVLSRSINVQNRTRVLLVLSLRDPPGCLGLAMASRSLMFSTAQAHVRGEHQRKPLVLHVGIPRRRDFSARSNAASGAVGTNSKEVGLVTSGNRPVASMVSLLPRRRRGLPTSSNRQRWAEVERRPVDPGGGGPRRARWCGASGSTRRSSVSMTTIAYFAAKSCRAPWQQSSSAGRQVVCS